MVAASWSRSFVDADGTRLNVWRTGSPGERPLVLAHGLSDSGRCWWRVAEVLGDSFDIIAIDARNHGLSDTAPGDMARHGDDVAAVVAAFDIERPSVMGHSMGARTVAEFAARHPRSADRLVVIDPSWTAGQETIGDAPADRIDAITNWLTSLGTMSVDELSALGAEQHPTWPTEELETWVESKQQARPEAASAFIGSGWGGVVADIECPTLLVCGESSLGAIVQPEVADRVCELNDRVSTQLIEGAGHNVHREQFDRFIAVVGSFLATD